MKVFIAVLVLIFSFQSWTKAEDIRDFQIEGMSIGDSLFDHFSKSEFNKAEKEQTIVYLKDNKFAELLFYKIPRFEIYDGVRVAFKPNDSKYKLYNIAGLVYFKGRYNDCRKKQKLVVNDIEKSLPGIKKKVRDKAFHRDDKKKQSYFEEIYFKLDSKELIRIYCINWSDELEELGNWDALNVIIMGREFIDFLRN